MSEMSFGTMFGARDDHQIHKGTISSANDCDEKLPRRVLERYNRRYS